MLVPVLAALLSVAGAYNFDEEVRLLNVDGDKCTTIITGATAGGIGPMVAHTSDCMECDFRLNKVPARDWPAGAMRPLYTYKADYPNTIASDRGATWQPGNLQGSPSQLTSWKTSNTTTGHIPQVAHTYALFEGLYGMMNEHQVAIGESTCASRFVSNPVIAGGEARIELRSMTKIALERTTNARDCIQMMGDLAVQYGFYGADWSGGDNSLGEGGEALTVIDKNEAWVFHVSADDLGTGAVWVAERVEDDHIAVVANQFVIRGVDPKSDRFMYSANLWEVAIRNQLWSKADGLLDFLKTYGLPRAHSPYATRRVWRVFNLAAPSIVLPPSTNMWGDDYPFSVPVDSVLGPADIMRFMRDHYEGTQFDLTQGLQSGPYGDPHRFDVTPVDNMTAFQMIQGAYERAISLYRTSYSFVAQSRGSVPDSLSLMWYSQYEPASSSYTPLYVGTDALPTGFTTGSLFKYDSAVAFWNFCAAGNYASRMYRYAMVDVRALQDSLYQSAVAAVQQLESYVTTSSLDDATVTGLVTKLTNEQGNAVVSGWRDLLPQLITKYHDGYQAQDLDTPTLNMRAYFYPKYWLDATGYWNNKPNTGPGVIMFEPSPVPAVSPSLEKLGLVSLTALVTCLLTLLANAYYVRHQEKKKNRRFQNNDYITINL